MSMCFVGGHVVAFTQVGQAGEAPSESELKTLPSTIPLFPLQEVMLFPHVGRPLHIFEPRYREMLAKALEGDRIIGMVMLRPGHEADYFGRPPIYSVGCAGVITDVEELPDGRYNIVLHGISKFRVKSEEQSNAYRVAEVETIPETLGDGDREALRRHRPRLLEALSSLSPGSQPTPDELLDEMLVNVLAQYHRMDSMKRLDLLEQDGPLTRAEALITLLRSQGTLALSLAPAKHGRDASGSQPTNTAVKKGEASRPRRLETSGLFKWR